MTRRRKSGLRSAVTLVSVTALVTSIVQQILTSRHLANREAPRTRVTAPDAPRWVGLRPTPDTLSPVLPQHPHAATGGAVRRAHII